MSNFRFYFFENNHGHAKMSITLTIKNGLVRLGGIWLGWLGQPFGSPPPTEQLEFLLVTASPTC